MREAAILCACREKGERIVKTMWTGAGGMARVSYHLHPSGRGISEQQFEHLAEWLEPIGDGLFDADTSQTWRMRPLLEEGAR